MNEKKEYKPVMLLKKEKKEITTLKLEYGIYGFILGYITTFLTFIIFSWIKF